MHDPTAIDPTALDYWTLAIAIVGALTGVAALAAQVWSIVLAGPRVKVTLGTAFSTGSGDWWLSLDASNVGRLPVTVLEMGVAVGTGGKTKKMPTPTMPSNLWQGPAVPHRLVDAEAATWLLRPAPLAVTLYEESAGTTKVRGYVRLATGTTVYSHKKADVQIMAEMI